MKKPTAHRLARFVAIVAATPFFLAHVAQACPGCKEVVVDGQANVSPASLGFAYSIGFMFLMVMSVIGSLVWMMIKSARTAWRPADENAYSVPPKNS